MDEASLCPPVSHKACEQFLVETFCLDVEGNENHGKWTPFQHIEVSDPTDAEFFGLEGNYYLAIANYNGKSLVYLGDGIDPFWVRCAFSQSSLLGQMRGIF